MSDEIRGNRRWRKKQIKYRRMKKAGLDTPWAEQSKAKVEKKAEAPKKVAAKKKAPAKKAVKKAAKKAKE